MLSRYHRIRACGVRALVHDCRMLSEPLVPALGNGRDDNFRIMNDLHALLLVVLPSTRVEWTHVIHPLWAQTRARGHPRELPSSWR